MSLVKSGSFTCHVCDLKSKVGNVLLNVQILDPAVLLYKYLNFIVFVHLVMIFDSEHGGD